MRRFSWQDEMAAELKVALASLSLRTGECLAGTYMTTDPAKCDVENRLFTNPGASSFPKGVTSTRFERGLGELPDPPVAIAPFAGQFITTATAPGTTSSGGNPTSRSPGGGAYPGRCPEMAAAVQSGLRYGKRPPTD
jgi:hypothetical protein